MKIALIDRYTSQPAKIADDLAKLAELLADNEETVFRCTCNEYDPPIDKEARTWLDGLSHFCFSSSLCFCGVRSVSIGASSHH